LIGAQLIRTPLGPGYFSQFYFKRTMRIFPAYFTVLFLLFFFPILRESESMEPLWIFLTFASNLFPRQGTTFYVNWSLCVEEHFYVLAPLILYCLLRARMKAKLITLCVVTVVAGAAYLRFSAWHQHVFPWIHNPETAKHKYFAAIYLPSFYHFEGLLVGVGIAAIQRFQKSWWNRMIGNYRPLMIVSALSLGLALQLTRFPYQKWTAILTPIAFALAYGCLLVVALSPQSLLSRARIPGTTTLATLSYAIYLVHRPVIRNLNKWFPWAPKDFWMSLVPKMLLIGAAAWVLHHLVEQPFLKLRNRILKAEHSKMGNTQAQMS